MSEITLLPVSPASPGEQVPEGDHLASLEALTQELIADETVRGLGATCLQGVRTSVGNFDGEPVTRVHRLYTVELDDHAHALEVTDPVEGKPAMTIVSFPGFTEHIEGGIRQKMQNHMADLFPQARVVSIASNGIGTTGDRYAISDRQQHGLQAMGEQRQRLTRAVAGQEAVFVIATSMGTVICHHMLQQNNALPLGEQSDIKGAMLISPAQVGRKHVARDMVLRFVPGLAIDITKELLFKTSWQDHKELLKLATKHNFHPSDIIALGHQLTELLKGTSWDEVEQVAAEVPTLVITGQKDSLAQHKLRAKLQAQYPDNVQTVVVPGRGHALVLKPERVCNKLYKAGSSFVGTQLHRVRSLTA